MNVIKHRVKRRIPELFCITGCGMEFPDYGLEPGDIFYEPIPIDIHLAVIEIEDVNDFFAYDQNNYCIACEVI